MNIENISEYSCQSQCLSGRCPFEKCIKYKSQITEEASNDIKMQILQSSGINLLSGSQGLGIAFDIGTTTVVGAIYDMSLAKQLAVVSGINRQYIFGNDVISRIKYCIDHTDGVNIQQNVIVKQLNEMIAVLCAEIKINSEDVSKMCISGNTLMLHLLLGESPVSMGTYPFTPHTLFGFEINSKGIGLTTGCECYLPPCASSFVGADIICGLTAIQFEKRKNASFMDIGTNGEVAAIADKVIYTSATAAGPAFEGVHITCGMAAVSGAISEVQIKNGNLHIKTIDDIEPKGLTGSGLIDAVAAFVRFGEIEISGRIIDVSSHYTNYRGMPALSITNNIFITQKDIREFQTAKAALCAGIITLIQHVGFERNKKVVSKNETLFLAGGFGNFMNIDNAQYLGLIPDSFDTVSVGNTSLAGAAVLMMNNKMRNTAEMVATDSQTVDLSVDPYFAEEYVDCMNLTARVRV